MRYTLDPFTISFEPCARPLGTWNEELILAARTITNTSKKPLWLCSNGGLMSEIMCRAFFDLGIHFSVLTIDTGSSRSHLKYAEKWCKSRGLSHRVMPYDMPSFFQDDVARYMREGYVAKSISSYFRIKLLEIIEELDGYAVLGGGAQHYLADSLQSSAPSDVYMEFDIGMIAPYEWCKKNAASHEPYFYFSTPEVTRAYTELPVVAGALRDPKLFFNPQNARLLRRLAAQGAWPDITPRPKSRFYEDFLVQKREAERHLAETFGSRIRTCRLSLPVLLEQLGARSEN